MIPNFDVLGDMIKNIHQSLSQLFFIALPVGILISVVIGYFQESTPNYVDILRRALVASLLLVSFPEVSNLILTICDGIALKIDNQSGIDHVLQLAEEKTRSYSTAKNALLLKFDDLFIAVLSYASFAVLYFARYLTVALYYFFWVLLTALSPILIFFYIFPSTSHMTRNLFKGLIEIASWKIIWALQSAMLISLSLGNVYKTEGSYLTLIVLNFIIALGMLCTPMIVKSLTGEGAQGMAQTLGASAILTMASIPAKAALIKTKAQSVSHGLGSTWNSQVTQRYQNYQNNKAENRKRLNY